MFNKWRSPVQWFSWYGWQDQFAGSRGAFIAVDAAAAPSVIGNTDVVSTAKADFGSAAATSTARAHDGSAAMTQFQIIWKTIIGYS